MSDHATHALAISELLARFFQAFDDKDWPAMRACLCDEVFADYSSFRDRPAATVPADRYVDQRRAALQPLAMQHNFLNLRVEVDPAAGHATARCNYVIHRFHPAFDGAGDDYFHSYGHYRFAFVTVAGAWKISRITQHLLRSKGNPELHGATRTRGLGREGSPP
jgi:3-phenylpropionate/cinnamic acid dioxygenase small subunit